MIPTPKISFSLWRGAALVLCAVILGKATEAGAADTGSRVAASAAAAASSVADKASSAVARLNESTYTGMPDAQRWERTHRVTRILGTDVRNRKGEKVGDVKDIVLDPHGTIAYAIVATGGFLGVGDRLHAVPWSALDTHGSKDYLIDIDKAALQKAPSFTARDWPNFADEQWLANNRRFYRDWNSSGQ